jgi:hypothetical protein
VRRRLLRSAPLSGPWGDLGDAPATNMSDLGMDMIAEQSIPSKNTMLLRYAPNLVDKACSAKLAVSAYCRTTVTGQ